MGQEAPKVGDFLAELDGDVGLQGRWRGNRGQVLRERGFSGTALAALESGNIQQIRDLLQQEQGGGQITCYIYIK